MTLCCLVPQCTSQISRHLNTLYYTGSEYYGLDDVPSIYWAFIDPGLGSNLLCTGSLRIKAQGMIASRQGLALAYPVIAAKPGGLSAVVAYAYSGNVTLSNGLGPAYAGG